MTADNLNSKSKPGPKKGTAPPHIQLKKRVDDLESKLDRIEMMLSQALPPELRALSAEQIDAAINRSNQIQFEVLADYPVPGTRAVWKVGRRLRGCDYPHVLDLVRAGLKLGVPRDNAEIVQELQAQAQAMEATREASTAAAAAASLRAQATASADHAEQMRAKSDLATAKAVAI